MHQSPAPGKPASPLSPSVGRRRAFLRVVATCCIVSAWLSLLFSVIGGFSLIAGGQAASAFPTPGLPAPGGGSEDPFGGLSPLPGAVGGPFLGDMLGRLLLVGGLLTILAGVIGWLWQYALGLLIFTLLDVEENTQRTLNALLAAARRAGG